MDSRHESRVQETLNALILEINYYLVEFTDELVGNAHLMQELGQIAQAIYQAAGMPVDASELISKRNLLSTHPILLPMVTDLTDDDETRLLPLSKAIAECSPEKTTQMATQLLPKLEESLFHVMLP